MPADPAASPGAPPPAAPLSVAPPAHLHHEGSVKETLESILVAFILAFIFRAFVVEAFVIPTGSMAPTLLGAHMRFRCKDCGYQWDVNYSGRTDGEDVRIPPFAEPVQERVNGETVLLPRVFSVRCPNCGFK